MKALLAKSQFVEVEGLTAFGPRFLDESLKLRARTLVVADFFPTLVALCKLTQLIKHSATLGVTEFWQFLEPGQSFLAFYNEKGKAPKAQGRRTKEKG
jgi:hypothetical protein